MSMHNSLNGKRQVGIEFVSVLVVPVLELLYRLLGEHSTSEKPFVAPSVEWTRMYGNTSGLRNNIIKNTQSTTQSSLTTSIEQITLKFRIRYSTGRLVAYRFFVMRIDATSRCVIVVSAAKQHAANTDTPLHFSFYYSGIISIFHTLLLLDVTMD